MCDEALSPGIEPKTLSGQPLERAGTHGYYEAALMRKAEEEVRLMKAGEEALLVEAERTSRQPLERAGTHGYHEAALMRKATEEARLVEVETASSQTLERLDTPVIFQVVEEALLMETQVVHPEFYRRKSCGTWRRF